MPLAAPSPLITQASSVNDRVTMPARAWRASRFSIDNGRWERARNMTHLAHSKDGGNRCDSMPRAQEARVCYSQILDLSRVTNGSIERCAAMMRSMGDRLMMGPMALNPYLPPVASAPTLADEQAAVDRPAPRPIGI